MKIRKSNKTDDWKKGVALIGLTTLLVLSCKYGNGLNNEETFGMREAEGEATSPVYAENANGEWESYPFIYEITYQYEDENRMLLVVPVYDEIIKQSFYQSLSVPEIALVYTINNDNSINWELKTGCMYPDYNNDEFSKMTKVKSVALYEGNSLLPLEDTIDVEDKYYEENNSLGRK